MYYSERLNCAINLDNVKRLHGIDPVNDTTNATKLGIFAVDMSLINTGTSVSRYEKRSGTWTAIPAFLTDDQKASVHLIKHLNIPYSTLVTEYGDPDQIVRVDVTVVSTSSGNKYYINGTLSSSFFMYRGITYRFYQIDSSNTGHPLRLSTTNDGTHGGGVEYTTGVTIFGTPGVDGYTQYAVPASTTTDEEFLYYYCTNHSGMGSEILILPTASA